jgi:hypothetical protein
MRGQKRVKDARERAYDPRIHPKRPSLKRLIARKSGLPEFRNIKALQVGQARFAVSCPAMTA